MLKKTYYLYSQICIFTDQMLKSYNRFAIYQYLSNQKYMYVITVKLVDCAPPSRHCLKKLTKGKQRWVETDDIEIYKVCLEHVETTTQIEA